MYNGHQAINVVSCTVQLDMNIVTFSALITLPSLRKAVVVRKARGNTKVTEIFISNNEIYIRTSKYWKLFKNV